MCISFICLYIVSSSFVVSLSLSDIAHAPRIGVVNRIVRSDIFAAWGTVGLIV
jgi:hypothetical protein